MKKFLLLLILFFPFWISAEEIDYAPNAKSAILMEYSTGNILYEKDAKEKMAPASMTKIMTLLLIMENIDSGKISLDDNVLVSANAAKMGGSQVFLEANSNMKLEELLKSIAIASANDSAVALAEYIAGTEDAYINEMNKKCESLGCKCSNFANVHGLDTDNHYSCAYDMAIIAKELIKHEKIFDYTTIYEAYLTKPDGSSTWMVNTNKLIKYYNGLDGLKTGFTDKAGYCLTATAKRNNMRLISVLMNEPTSQTRNEETINMLNYGFTNYKLKTILDTNKDLGTIEVINGKKEEVHLKLINDATNLEKINDEKDYTYNINVNKIKAPVKVNDEVGSLDIIESGKVIKSIPITVSEDIKKANFFDLWFRNIRRISLGN